MPARTVLQLEHLVKTCFVALFLVDFSENLCFIMAVPLCNNYTGLVKR